MIELVGILENPRITQTQTGKSVYHATVVIPTQYQNHEGQLVSSKHYVPIVAWQDLAEGLAELEEGTPVNVLGSMLIRKYDGTCDQCNGTTKRRWAEVKVSYFEVYSEDEAAPIDGVA